MFVRSSSQDTPSLLHRYSIVSPSFRWSSDGPAMDQRWSNYGEEREEKEIRSGDKNRNGFIKKGNSQFAIRN